MILLARTYEGTTEEGVTIVLETPVAVRGRVRIWGEPEPPAEVEGKEDLRSFLDRATEIRARYRCGVADSVHLAAALASGCDLFPTNDLRLTGFPDMQAVMV